jgi:hypothetical protein
MRMPPNKPLQTDVSQSAVPEHGIVWQVDVNSGESLPPLNAMAVGRLAVLIAGRAASKTELDGTAGSRLHPC